MKYARLVATAAFALGTAFASGPALALPGNEYYRIYYSDSDMIDVVGERMLSCGGARINRGVVSPYVEVVFANSCAEPTQDPCLSWPSDWPRFGPCPF